MSWHIYPTYCCGQWRSGRCVKCPVLLAREKAIHAVDDHTQQWWREEAFKAADRVMSRLETFTTDDIWINLERRGVEAPHEPRAMGPIIRVLTKSQEIKFTGRYTQSVIPRGHGRTVKIYTVMA